MSPPYRTLTAAQEAHLLAVAQDRPSNAREVTRHALKVAGMLRGDRAPTGITPSGAAHAAHLLGVELDTGPWAQALADRDNAWRDRGAADEAWKATVQREDRERAAALRVLRAGGGAA
jgi:hypothetical protein